MVESRESATYRGEPLSGTLRCATLRGYKLHRQGKLERAEVQVIANAKEQLDAHRDY